METGTNVIDLSDEDEIIYTIKSINGDELTLSDINEEDLFLEIYASRDMEKIEIIKLDSEISGEISQIDHDEEKISVEDKEYSVYSSKVGTIVDFSDIKLGSYCKFVLNSAGEIVNIEVDLTQGDMQYGYVYNIGRKKGLKGEVEIKILKGTLTEQLKERDKYYLISKDVQKIEILSTF